MDQKLKKKSILKRINVSDQNLNLELSELSCNSKQKSTFGEPLLGKKLFSKELKSFFDLFRLDFDILGLILSMGHDIDQF